MKLTWTQDFCTHWPAVEWVSTFGNRRWLTCRIWQRCVGGLPGAVGGYRTCAAVSFPRRVQRRANVQVQLLCLKAKRKRNPHIKRFICIECTFYIKGPLRSDLHWRGSDLWWWQLFKAKRSPPFCSHLGITGNTARLTYPHVKKYNTLKIIFLKMIQHKKRWVVPDNRVSADNELRFGVPLVVRDIIMSLQPYPLLTFGQEAIVAGFTLSKLHHWKEGQGF